MSTDGQASAAAWKERITQGLQGRSFSLQPDTLGVRAVEAVLRGLFEEGRLRMQDAELTSTDDTVTVTGRAAIFQVPSAQVTATFHLGGAEPALVLSATGFPLTWTLSASFPGMAGTLLDSIGLRHPVISIDSRNTAGLKENFQVELGLPPNAASQEKYLLRGLTFQAEVDLGPLNAIAWMLEGKRIEVRGPMELQGDVVRAWLRSDPLSPFELGGFSFPFEVQLISWFDEAKSPRTFARLAAAATCQVNGSPFTVPLAAMVDSPAVDQLTLEAGLEDVSRLAFSELSRAMGVADFMGQVGGSFPSLDGVTLQSVAVTLSVASRSVAGFTVAVRLEKTVEVLPGEATLGGFTLRFTLAQPGTAQSQLYASATVDARLFGARFTGFMTLPRMKFGLSLNAGESIDLAALVARLLPDVKGPPLSCQQFRVYGSLGQPSLSMFIELDGAWRIPIGFTGLTVEQLVLSMDHDRAGGQSRTQGFVGGDVNLGDDLLISALWQVPGGLFLRGTVPDIQLMDVVEKLCGKGALDGIPVAKDLLSVELTDATVTADFKTNTFSLSATAGSLGRGELFIERPAGGGWGLGLGLYLSSDIKFSKLHPVLSVLDGFKISNPYLVLSTFQARELALPDQPSGYATRMQKGVNFYLPVLLEPKGALASLKNVLGKDGASLVLSGAFNEQGCRLEAAMAGFEIGGGVSFEAAGFRLFIEPDGDVALSVFGRVAVKLKDRLLFSGELMLQPNGATLSATMEGTWREPFGIPGFTLSDVALMLGVSLQGLPTVGLAGKAVISGTQGAFAVLINSVDPAESVLSMKFSRLGLSPLLEAALSPDVRKSLPAPLLSLLSSGFEDVDVYLVPESTTIGQLYYPQGFRFKGTLRLLGWKASVNASMAFTSGLKVEGSAEPLRLGRIKKDTYAFELTAARSDLFKTLEQKAKGEPAAFPGSGKKPIQKPPPSAVETEDLGGPQLRISLGILETPSFFFSCRASLFGFIDQEVLAEVGDGGAKLALQRKVGSTELALTCQIGSKGLNATGRFVFALSLDLDLNVPGTDVTLCHVSLKTQLDGALTLLITANVFRAEVDGGFQYKSFNLRIPKVVLSAPPADIAALIARATEEIAEDAYAIFKPVIAGFDSLMNAVDQGLVTIGAAAGQTAEQLGDALKKAYRDINPEKTAKALKKAGCAAEDTAKYLQKSWNKSEDEVRKLLGSAGFTSSDIEKAAKSVYKSTEQAVTSAAKSVEKGGKKAVKSVKKALKF
jgi:hypothetical protein